MDSRTTLELHVASQYLAAAAKMYLPAKDDDSHTNMGWNPNQAAFFSRTFANRDSLMFHTKRMTLEWKGTMKESLVVDGHTHAEVIKWLEEVSRKNGVKKYIFDLHYTLESGAIKDDFRFGETTAEALDSHAEYRTKCVKAGQSALTALGLEAEIRTWPHHFDTGGYIQIPNEDLGIGFGLSIPGSVVDEYYLYAAGYKDGKQISTVSLSPLAKGKWVSGEWKGGVLPVAGLAEGEYVGFFEETISKIQESM